MTGTIVREVSAARRGGHLHAACTAMDSLRFSADEEHREKWSASIERINKLAAPDSRFVSPWIYPEDT